MYLVGYDLVPELKERISKLEAALEAVTEEEHWGMLSGPTQNLIYEALPERDDAQR